MKSIKFIVFVILTINSNYLLSQDKDSITNTLKNYIRYYPEGTINDVQKLWDHLSPSLKEDTLILAYKAYAKALVFYKKRLPDTAFYYFDKVGRQINFQEDPYLVNESLIYQGITKSMFGEHRAGKVYLDSAYSNIELHTEIPYEVYLNINMALGEYYTNVNQQEKAINHLLTSLNYLKKDAYDVRKECIIKKNLGILFETIGDLDKAKSYFQEMQALGKSHKRPAWKNLAILKLTKIAIAEEEIDNKIEEKLDAAIQFYLKNNENKHLAVAYNHLGEIQSFKNNFTHAEISFNKGIAASKEINYPPGLAMNYLNLGKLYLQKSNPNTALQYFNQSKEWIYGKTNIDMQIDLEEQLAKTYKLLGDDKLAYYFLEKVKTKTDSINLVRTAQKVQTLETKYQSSEKENQIKLLESQQRLASQKQKTERIYLIIGLIVITLFSFTLLLLYRNRKKTNQKLRELDVAKSTFFTNISHEFRTPLSLIKGPISEKLNTKNLSLIDRQKTAIVKKNVEKIENLVEELLALSKLESKHYQVKLSIGNLNSFLKAQASSFEFLAKDKDITYKLAFEQEGTTNAIFDKQIVTIILNNLIGNAIKYTPQGGLIKLFGKQKKEYYQLEITNTGNKISPEDKHEIFKRFYQLNHHKVGTGVGLALSKELAELHKGSLQLIDTKESQNVFQLTLGTHKELFSKKTLSTLIRFEDEKLERKIENEQEKKDSEKSTLLLVDDNLEILEYLALLFKENFVVQTAKNGNAAFTKCLENIPDLVISDVAMPNGNGFDLTKQIKQNPLTAHIPIILLTAKSEEEDKLMGSSFGADAYLTKPFHSELLRATVHNLIENRRILQERYTKTISIEAKTIAISDAEKVFLNELQKVIDSQLCESNFNAEKFAEAMHVSRMQLHRKLKALTGKSTTEFIKSQRIKTARKILQKEGLSVAEVAYAVGFNDASYFSRTFKEIVGIAPSEY